MIMPLISLLLLLVLLPALCATPMCFVFVGLSLTHCPLQLIALHKSHVGIVLSGAAARASNQFRRSMRLFYDVSHILHLLRHARHPLPSC
ncbi:hypothetical protein BKA62DRAFT_717550 [Auriculariales sp. MPI-PUGE-AT-0066]|nr:hypothetical protein BKA62DRAFT_717550 [Auriculariales sp. MPI-PUGE-AT-0066]